MVFAIGVIGSLMSRAPFRPSPSQQDLATNATASSADASSSSSSPTSSDDSNPSDQSVELHRDDNGHFYADVEINGAQVHMLVDTGASAIALSRDDARKAGIATSIAMPNVVGQGADGDVHGEVAIIDRMSLGQKTAEKMPALVLNSGEQSLLGQSFLQKFASVEIHGDTMVLR